MSTAQLRARLVSLLEPYLGTYTRSNGSITPAIWVGEPESAWTVEGLECLIDAVPEIKSVKVYKGASLSESYDVRLVMHGADALPLHKATRAVLLNFDATDPRYVPANESLGILKQTIFTIRS